jgi:DNA-directed RNA polymerase subunit RPC12/RpoP
MAEDASGFLDPVIRCDSCQALVRRTTVHSVGACDKCGNRRMRNLHVFNEEEKKQLEEWGFGEFAAEFGVVQ